MLNHSKYDGTRTIKSKFRTISDSKVKLVYIDYVTNNQLYYNNNKLLTNLHMRAVLTYNMEILMVGARKLL